MERTGESANTVDVPLVHPSRVVETSGDCAAMAVEKNVEKDEQVIDWDVLLRVFASTDYYNQLPPGYHMYYIFDEQGQPIPSDDIHAFHALFVDIQKRRVALTVIRFRGIAVEVSTVFTVHNTDYSFSQFPVLWETMTFTSDCARVDCWQNRYRYREVAVYGHETMVQRVLTELKRHPRSTRRMKVAARRKKSVEAV